MTGGLGRRYARALLTLAREDAALAKVGEDLAQVGATFAQPDLRSVVLSPGIAAIDRRGIVERIVQKLDVSTVVGNLIRLLADRDRLGVLPDVIREYEVLVDREIGRARVTIRTAAPLTDAQVVELEGLAQRLTGSKTVVVSTQVDAELIGGVVLDAHGTVYDGSIKTQLARLADSMAGARA